VPDRELVFGALVKGRRKHATETTVNPDILFGVSLLKPLEFVDCSLNFVVLVREKGTFGKVNADTNATINLGPYSNKTKFI